MSDHGILRDPAGPSRILQNPSDVDRILQDLTDEYRFLQNPADEYGISVDPTEPDMTRRLLEAHSNLFLSIKSAKGTIKKTKLERQKALKPDWKALIEDFPDRFMIGSDLKYRGGGRTQGGGMKVYKKILKQLSPGARKSVASENARRIFKLNR